MRSMLPTLMLQAATLEKRAEGAAATLDLLRDLGMNTREHEHSVSYLNMRLAAIKADIAILKQGYALKETRNADAR